MGIAVSSWQLARAVASAGQIGVVSATAIDTVVVRELQQGDPHGRLALEAGISSIADRLRWARTVRARLNDLGEEK